MFSRSVHMAVATSVFAGLLGAGVIDLGLVAMNGEGVGLFDAVCLILGLYGAIGLIAGLLAGSAAAVVSNAIPGGPTALRTDADIDRRIAIGLLTGAIGAAVLGALEAASYSLFISKMHSRSLATIAAFGTSAMAVPIAVLIALALWRPVRAVVLHLPRPACLGRTGLIAAVLLGGGTAAVLLAFSRADWRVLDLGPAKAAGLAVGLGIGHWLVWHTSNPISRSVTPGMVAAARTIAALAVLVMLVPASRIPEGANIYEALEDHSLGMRHVLGLARLATDRDGDGFSARFGGGDCDDHNEETYPGAEEIPGDGIDQNCQGGDAALVAEDTAPTAATPPPTVKKRAGAAFAGNILVISIDAFRADRLGVAGYKRRRNRSLTPNLDALARSGAYFRKVWSHAPNTPRSFPAFLTSRYPSEIAWAQRSLNYSPILPQNETFFEQLGRAGWKPIGIFSHFYFAPERALGQGFAEWSNDGARSIADSNKDTAAPRIVPRVIARLKLAAARKEKIALWTHLFEPHSSYMEHPEFPSRLRGVDGLEEKYDYEIAFVDKWVGKILATLDSTGLRKTTTVVVVADHGEAWGEHKHFFHGQDLTEEQLRVPLIVAIPGRKPVVVDSEAALVDVGPTLLDLVGLQAPASFRGRSLLPAMADEGGADDERGAAAAETLPPKPVFAELLPASAWPKHEVMMVLNGKKIVHKITERRWELYDLATDPRQKRDLAREPQKRALLAELRSRVIAFEEGRR
jgi:choline-sulfatase